MIYELRTYNLRPGTLDEIEKNIAEVLPYREKFSKLGAFWHTDIGPLYQIVHIWPYKDHGERALVRDAAAKETRWPPRTDGAIIDGQVEIFIPAPFMRELHGQALGSVYEMCTSTYRSGTMREVLKRWAECLPYRERYSPLAVGMYSELGGLNKWIDIWPYKDFNERNEIRAQAGRSGHWPPPTEEFLIRQETKILIPAAFSPLH